MAVRHGIFTTNASTAVAVSYAAKDMGRDATVVFTNVDATNDVVVGDSAVSAANYGYVIKSGETWTVENVAGDDVFYCLATAGNPVLHVLAYNA